MAVIRNPLRVGMAVGSPIVTWASSSVATATANATASAITAGVAPSVMTLTSMASVSINAARLCPGVIRGDGQAVGSLSAIRAVAARGRVEGVADVHLVGGKWEPRQPERRVTYRRYQLADYHQMLMDLLPRGRAWPRDGLDSDLMLAWAAEYERVEQRGWQLLEEIDPRTTTELLPEWESIFQLPGVADEAQRRKELIAAFLAGGSLGREDLENMLRTLGITATIKYWQPFRCGISVCGDPLATEFYSAITIAVHEPKGLDLTWLQTYLRGIGSGGDYIHVTAA